MFERFAEVCTYWSSPGPKKGDPKGALQHNRPVVSCKEFLRDAWLLRSRSAHFWWDSSLGTLPLGNTVFSQVQAFAGLFFCAFFRFQTPPTLVGKPFLTYPWTTPTSPARRHLGTPHPEYLFPKPPLTESVWGGAQAFLWTLAKARLEMNCLSSDSGQGHVPFMQRDTPALWRLGIRVLFTKCN